MAFCVRRSALIGVAALSALVSTTACDALLTADATAVPGAAATLTRGARTPIPTPLRDASPVPSPGATPAAASPTVRPASAAAASQVTEADAQPLQRALQESPSSPDMDALASLLHDQVSFTSPDGGQVFTRADADAWLRAHAAPDVHVVQVEPVTSTGTLRVTTAGWKLDPPATTDSVTFGLHRYDANGEVDPDAGTWSIDVIEAD